MVEEEPDVLLLEAHVAVGGLAYDQLTQLPTEEETAARKAVKGKRALGKNNR